MPEGFFVTVYLGDDNFEFIPTKTGWIKAHYRTLDTGWPEDYPVYTATLEPVAFVRRQKDDPIDATEDSPVISFGANGDGSAGTNLVFHTRPFYISNDRTCIRVQSHGLLPTFVFHSLRGMKKLYGFDFHYKATKPNVSQVSIEVPITPEGKFNIPAQQQLVARYQKWERLNEAVKDSREQVAGTLVALDIPESLNVPLSDESAFELCIGKRLLKKNVTDTGIPIYSANVREPFGFTSEHYLSDYARASLLWGIDTEAFDWNLIPPLIPFVPTDHCGVLRIRNSRIIPEYVYSVLRASKAEHGFDRSYRASLGNIKRISVPIPRRPDGFDVDAQKAVAKRYARIDHLRETLVSELDRLLSVQIYPGPKEG